MLRPFASALIRGMVMGLMTGCPLVGRITGWVGPALGMGGGPGFVFPEEVAVVLRALALPLLLLLSM